MWVHGQHFGAFAPNATLKPLLALKRTPLLRHCPRETLVPRHQTIFDIPAIGRRSICSCLSIERVETDLARITTQYERRVPASVRPSVRLSLNSTPVDHSQLLTVSFPAPLAIVMLCTGNSCCQCLPPAFSFNSLEARSNYTYYSSIL